MERNRAFDEGGSPITQTPTFCVATLGQPSRKISPPWKRLHHVPN